MVQTKEGKYLEIKNFYDKLKEILEILLQALQGPVPNNGKKTTPEKKSFTDSNENDNSSLKLLDTVQIVNGRMMTISQSY